MPGVAAFQVEQLVVALAHDRDRRVGRHRAPGHQLDPLDQLLVLALHVAVAVGFGRVLLAADVTRAQLLDPGVVHLGAHRVVRRA